MATLILENKIYKVNMYLTTTDHRKIGQLYMIFGFVAAIAGSFLSILIRVQLGTNSLVSDQLLLNNYQYYNVIITLHAVIMIFLFVMPVLIGGFGNYFVPILIGAPEMAFPRLNNASFWLLPISAYLSSLAPTIMDDCIDDVLIIIYSVNASTVTAQSAVSSVNAFCSANESQTPLAIVFGLGAGLVAFTWFYLTSSEGGEASEGGEGLSTSTSPTTATPGTLEASPNMEISIDVSVSDTLADLTDNHLWLMDTLTDDTFFLYYSSVAVRSLLPLLSSMSFFATTALVYRTLEGPSLSLGLHNRNLSFSGIWLPESFQLVKRIAEQDRRRVDSYCGTGLERFLIERHRSRLEHRKRIQQLRDLRDLRRRPG